MSLYIEVRMTREQDTQGTEGYVTMGAESSHVSTSQGIAKMISSHRNQERDMTVPSPHLSQEEPGLPGTSFAL